MSALRLLLQLPVVLRRTIYFTQDFGRNHIVRDFRTCQYQAFRKSIDKEIDDNDGTATKKQRPKTVPIPKITLVFPDNSITVVVLEEAQNLAKRRKFNLVKVSDPVNKKERPVYKLVSRSSMLDKNIEEKVEENIKDTTNKEQKAKSPKLFYISDKIAEHDLRTKIKNMIKLLNKKYKVKIAITIDDTSEGKTQSIIENEMKNAGSIQKMPSKKNTVLFLITPLSNSEDSSVLNKEKIDTSSTIN